MSNGGAGYDYEVWQGAWNARQPEVVAPAAEVPIPTVEEIADHIDVWFRSGEDKPWSFIVEDLAGSIHAMLTDRIKGVKHGQ